MFHTELVDSRPHPGKHIQKNYPREDPHGEAQGALQPREGCGIGAAEAEQAPVALPEMPRGAAHMLR